MIMNGLAKHPICVAVLVLAGVFLSVSGAAQTIPSDSYLTWGITTSKLSIPVGSVITDAVLTLHGVSVSTDAFDVYLLDNPRPGTSQKLKTRFPSVFSGYGHHLAGTLTNGDFVCRLRDSQNNDSRSFVWNTFSNPFVLGLADGQTVSYTSALLALIDYAGTGVSFGFGVESTGSQALSYSSLELTLTVSAFEGQPQTQTLRFTGAPAAMVQWKMDDNAASPQVIDSGLNGYHGTAKRRTDQLSAVGRFGNALWFDGESDAVNFGHPAGLQTTGQLSLSLWFQAYKSGTYQFLVSRENGGTARSYAMFLMPQGNLRFQVFRQQQCFFVDSFGNLADGRWHHVVGVNDGQSLKIYVDGRLSNSLAGAGGRVDNTSANVWLGARGDSRYYFNGLIDEVGIFTSALNADDIVTLSGQDSYEGPIGYWAMDDAASTLKVTDSSGNGYHGVTKRMTNQMSVPGYTGNALMFDGSTDMVNFGRPSGLQITGQFSLSLWFQTSRSGAYQFLISKENGGTSRSYAMFLMPQGNLRFQVFRQQQCFFVDSFGNLADGRWHHVAGVNDGQSLKIYVDGRLSSSLAGAGGVIDNTSADVWLGARGDNRYFFSGLIDEVAVYATSLDLAGVQGIYGKDTADTLMAKWAMDDNTSSPKVTDSSANAYHAAAKRTTAQLSAAGRVGNALWFDGSADYVNAGRPSGLQITGQMTLSVWFQANRSGAYQFLISKENGGAARSYAIFLMPQGNLRFQVFRQQQCFFVDSIGNLTDGNWHHAACVNDGQSLKIYVDGQLNSTAAGVGGSIDNTSADVWMGARGDGRYYFNGLMDEVAIYGSALSQEQIQGL